jgi:D-alanyl-D-alanine carboxypeptidase (penicillin-binding protein 5/6)
MVMQDMNIFRACVLTPLKMLCGKNAGKILKVLTLWSLGLFVTCGNCIVLSENVTKTYATEESSATDESSVAEEASTTEESNMDEESSATGESDKLQLESPSCILMEAETGTVLYEKDADQVMAPASVTKIMTLLLIFEAMDKGQFSLDDMVTVSSYAASMGGSQCFFEQGETQSVEDMIKCIIIASGNDAAVAMGEFVSGSESAFVDKMNEKAKNLGMENTTFKNACGLDVEGHVTTSRDIALMTRELITKYPEIFDYSSIWMDSIVHKTARGESEFGLVNTNKFLKMYTGATGLKTGYTSTAKYCMSATANRDGLSMIAVIMGASTKDIRNQEACTLLDYGYGKCKKYVDLQVLTESEIKINKGEEKYVTIETDDSFSGILLEGEEAVYVKKKLELEDDITAPVKKGDVLGKMNYYMGDRLIGSVDIRAAEAVEKMTLSYALKSMLRGYICN